LCAQCFFHLALGLADGAEDDVLARVAGLERSEQLAPGDDVEAGAELAEKGENGDAGVRLYAVVEPRVDIAHRGAELRVLVPDHGGAIDVAWRPNLASKRVERDPLELASARITRWSFTRIRSLLDFGFSL